MPRKNRRERIEMRPIPAMWSTRTRGPGGERFEMRPVTASGAKKRYTCPHCFGPILPGVAHVVAWPANDPDERWHWHTGCWHRRG